MGDITLRDILNAKSQGEREPLPGLIAISVDSKLSGALDLLRQFNIQSVPVYGTAGRWIGAGETQVMTLDGKQYLAMISVCPYIIYLTKSINLT